MRANIILTGPETSENGGIKRDFISPFHGSGTIETIVPQNGGTVAAVEFHERRDFAPQIVSDSPNGANWLLNQRTANLLDRDNAALLTVRAINQAIRTRRVEIGKQIIKANGHVNEALVQQLLFGPDLREMRLADDASQ